MGIVRIKARKIIVATAGIVTVIASATIMANWTFLRRLFTYPDDPITNVDWYEPLEAVPAGNPTPLPVAKTTIIPQASLARLVDYAKAQNSSALLVMHQGKIVLEEYWQGFTPTDTFNSMSMSKTITALLIGIAIAEGHIESELEPVANYITEWQGDQRGQISIQDLLYMQSGLRNQDNTEDPRSDLVRMYGGVDADAIALKVPATENPKTSFDYNNVNTQILSEVLERATGKRYSQYLAERIWQPLEADNAYLWLDRSQGNPKAFCCLFATPRDWLKVGQLFLNQGRVRDQQLVEPTWLQKMMQPSSLEPKYGYHLWLKARTKDQPKAYNPTATAAFLADTIYLDGASHQRVYIIPTLDLVVLRIGEAPIKWDDAQIPNILVSGLRDATATEQK